MRISIDTIAASCPACGATEFEPLVLGTDSASETLVCAKCGTKSLHADLITRIGDEALRQAKDALAEMRRRRIDKPHHDS